MTTIPLKKTDYFKLSVRVPNLFWFSSLLQRTNTILIRLVMHFPSSKEMLSLVGQFALKLENSEKSGSRGRRRLNKKKHLDWFLNMHAQNIEQYRKPITQCLHQMGEIIIMANFIQVNVKLCKTLEKHLFFRQKIPCFFGFTSFL